MIKYTVALDGKTIGKRTSGRIYTWAIAALRVQEQRKAPTAEQPWRWAWFAIEPTWTVYSFHRTQALASKALSAWKGHDVYTEAKIVPVTGAVEVKKRAPKVFFQFTPATCPGRPCGSECDHVGRV